MKKRRDERIAEALLSAAGHEELAKAMIQPIRDRLKVPEGCLKVDFGEEVK